MKNAPHAGVLTAEPQTAACVVPGRCLQAEGREAGSARSGHGAGVLQPLSGALLVKQESKAGWWVSDGRRSAQECGQPRLPSPAAPEVTSGQGRVGSGPGVAEEDPGVETGDLADASPAARATHAVQEQSLSCLALWFSSWVCGAARRAAMGADSPAFTPPQPPPRRSHKLWKHLELHNEGARARLVFLLRV